jgi:predicted HTH transcriptional regulator
MDDKHLLNVIRELITLPDETEWVEFKHNLADPQGIGEYLSALANSAALHGKENGYLLWGVEDDTHRIVGTDFDPRKSKVGNQEYVPFWA